MKAFVSGYIEAMYFTEGGPDGEGPEFDAAELSPEACETIARDCEAFNTVAGQILAIAYKFNYDSEQAGRDFWFTRNGHGVGFWDRPELQYCNVGETLTALAHAMIEASAYVGDDGMIYL